MNFSTWAIKNPIPVSMLFVLLMVLGIFGFKKLKINDFPNMEYPAVIISISVPGATPEQLDTQITTKIENSIANVSSIQHIHSSITDGTSTTVVQFELDKNLQDAINEVKDAIDKIKSNFPPGTNEPQIYKVSVSDHAVLTYKITGDVDIADLSWIVDNEINKRLSAIAGVGKITRQGGVEREVQVLLDPSKLITLDTTINNVSNQLYNVRQDFSGGRIAIGGTEQVIQARQNINNVNDLRNLDIPLPNSTYVKLKDIATVKDSYADIRQMAFFNGKPIISFQVFPAKNINQLDLAKNIKSVIDVFNKTHPNLKIDEISSNPIKQLKNTYDSSMQAFYEGAILAILVVFLFLRDWRATFVAATALPLSIIPTFFVIYWMGFSLNVVTLLALTLVIGVLVDDAIVEVENIVRHLKSSSSPIKAAMEASTEIGLAVIATSLTLVAIFLPTAFMGGIPGRVFKEFGWGASISVLISLLVARLLTPMLAAKMLKAKNHSEEQGFIISKYIVCVKWCLNHRGKTMLFATGFFILSMLLVTMIPSTFFPAANGNSINLSFQLPPGSKIEDSAQMVNKIGDTIKNIPEITGIYATIGTGIQNGSSSNLDSDVSKGQVTIDLLEAKKRKHTEAYLSQMIQKQLTTIPGVKFSLNGDGSGEKYSLLLAGEDVALLKKVANEIETNLRQDNSFGNISSSANVNRPELSVNIDFNHAAEMGVTASGVGEVVRVATSGDYDNRLARLNLPDRQIPIRVKLDNHFNNSINDLGNLRVSGIKGPVPLANLAQISYTSGPIEITRYDRSRIVTISIELHGQNIGDVDKKIKNLPLMKNLPNGVHQIVSGDLEYMNDMFGNFLWAMIIGVFCIYCLLVLLFKDFKQPVTILSALPFAISGALSTLVIFGFSLSMSSLIGILMLMGIVTKNSILLVDYAITEMNRPNVDACVKRSRPVVMTTIAMIFGMLPIALGLHGDSSFRAPMALTVIGGLITSTVLSLLVVPVIFELIDEFGKKWR